tara:strand:+ start:6546 stop:10757 length:4212 start_codon:yes stop_codon:yes gene_type:complete
MGTKNRRKTRINWKWHLLEAAMEHLRSQPDSFGLTEEQIQRRAVNSIDNMEQDISFPMLKRSSPINSEAHQHWLRRMKWYATSNNIKSNTLKNLIAKDGREAFAMVKEIQRELMGFLSEVIEEEQKILGNYSKVHYNSFTRSIDKPMQWANQLMIKDYKTGFPYKEKFLMDVINNSGLGLPLKGSEKIPVRDIYIVDELTDTGDTMAQVVKGDPMDLNRANKNFHYVVMRRENDNTTRKYKTKTSFDTYPHSCVSTLTIELEFPSIVQINYFSFTPIGDSTISIPSDGLSYRSEDGADISMNAVTIPGETSTTLIFQPVWTRYLRISFEQFGTVGRTELTLGDPRREYINRMLEGNGFTSRLPDAGEKVKGRIYDFSLAEVGAGFYAFEPKGIYRSGTPVLVDSPIGFDLRWEAEQLSPIESFDTYMKTATFPEGRVLIESYLDVRLYGGGKVPAIHKGDSKRKISDMLIDTLVVDSLVPVPDSYPIQMEFLAPIVFDSKLKLFPNFKWNKEKFIVKSIHLHRDKNVLSNSILELISFLTEGYSYEEKQNLFSKLGYTPSTPQASTKWTTGTIPHGIRFDDSNSEHVFAHNVISDAVKDIASARRPSVERNVQINFIAPSKEDLSFLLGEYYTEADLALKYEIENFPENFLLLSSDILWGTNKYLKNIVDLDGNRLATIFAKTCVKQNASTRNFLNNCLNTKTLALDITNIEPQVDRDIVSVQMRAVRSPEDLGSLNHLAIKHKEQIIRRVSINNSVLRLQKFIRDVCLGLKSGGFENEDFSWSEGVALLSKNKKSLTREVEDLYKRLWFNISNSEWGVVKIPPNESFGIFSKKNKNDNTWVQTLGSSGSSVFGAVYNNDMLREQDLGDFTRNELATTYSLPRNHEYFNISGNSLAKTLHRAYKSKPKIPYEKYEIKTKLYEHASLSVSLTEEELNVWHLSLNGLPPLLQIIDAEQETDIDTLRYQFKNLFLILSSFIEVEEPIWRFTTVDRHELSLGDTISFSSTPSDFLGGEYIVVNVDAFNFDVKVLSNGTSQVGAGYSYCIDGLSPSMAFGNFKTISDLTSFHDISDVPYSDKPNPFMRQSDGRYDYEEHNKAGEVPGSYNDYLKATASYVLGKGINLEDQGDFLFDLLDETIRDTTYIDRWMKGIDNSLRKRDLFTLWEKIIDFHSLLKNHEASPYSNEYLADKVGDIISYHNVRVSVDKQVDNYVYSEIDILSFGSGESEGYSGAYDDFPVTKLLCSGWQSAPFDVYENDIKLLIGEDYLISLNEKSDWLGFWPTDGSLDKYWEHAEAGRCYVKIKDRNSSSFYWVKYRVHGEQKLSSEGKIYLNNGRVTCDSDLLNSSGTVDVVLVARTNSYNPYITPIVGNYSLRIQEQPNVMRNSGKLQRKNLRITKRRGTNVS